MWHPLTLPCVIRPPCFEKREISTTSESNKIRRGCQISRDDFNGEVHFIIRDLEYFRIFTEITILPIFEKIGFSRGFTKFILESKICGYYALIVTSGSEIAFSLPWCCQSTFTNGICLFRNCFTSRARIVFVSSS